MTEPCSPIKRGHLRLQFGFGVTILLVIGTYIVAPKWQNFVLSLSFSGAGVVFGHFLMRLYLLCEEMPLIDRTCDGRIPSLLNRLLPNGYTGASMVALVVPALAVLTDKGIGFLVHDPTPILFFLSTSAGTFFSLIIRAEQCPVWEDHTMTHLNGLDYGSGMAQSYFYGYLKLVLPAKGTTKNLSQRITTYMESERLKDHSFPVKKLIVLIPSSGYSYPTLRDVPSQVRAGAECDITPLEGRDLEAHVQDRAGTQARQYRVGSYRIRVRQGDKVAFLYALIEGATPLLTFKEACQGSEHLRRHKVDIVSNFFRTLSELIDNDPECKHLVWLREYNDEDASNAPDIVNIIKTILMEECDKSKVFGDAED